MISEEALLKAIADITAGAVSNPKFDALADGGGQTIIFMENITKKLKAMFDVEEDTAE